LISLILRSDPRDRVSKDEAATVAAPSFETHRFAMLLRMRAERE
jgi:hypothetical protein